MGIDDKAEIAYPSWFRGISMGSKFKPVAGTRFTAEQLIHLNSMMDSATHDYWWSQPALQNNIVAPKCEVCGMPTRLTDPVGDPVCSACQ